jgi:cellulose synthase/poly-beta-1,6-N-acetylglucosamine synthase-like glycosyltransferase
VLARNAKLIQTKIYEIERIGLPFIVICGENFPDSRVVQRAPVGKWDAINYGYGLIPRETDVVVLNDVDTEIHGLEHMLSSVVEGSDFAYAAVRPSGGSQPKFYAIANPLNRVLKIFAMGELVVIRKKVLDNLMPIPPCLAEDTYLLFKAMELNYKVDFCEDAYVNTIRTSSISEEVLYKERTTLGILQALDYTRPPPWIILFYRSLPILAAMLMLGGEDGRAWARGIMRAIRLHIEGSNRTSF